jgi:HPt (histidine-containing phosphotransfer) domain-containing protein
MMDSLFSRRAKSGETRREGRSQRARAAAIGGPEPMRREMPEATTLLKTLLASRNLLIAIKDLDGRYLQVNKLCPRSVSTSRGSRSAGSRSAAAGCGGDLAQRERLAMCGVVLKPELESFDREAPGRAPTRARRHWRSPGGMHGSDRVASLRRRSRQNDAACARCRCGPPPAEGPATGEIWLSEAARSTQLDWDAALYRSLLSHFCQRYEGFPSRVAERLVAGKTDGLARELSQLARGARNLGALPLADLALGLLSILQRDGGEGLDPHLPELRRVLGATVLVMECRILATAEALEWPMAIGGWQFPAPTGVLSAA